MGGWRLSSRGGAYALGRTERLLAGGEVAPAAGLLRCGFIAAGTGDTPVCVFGQVGRGRFRFAGGIEGGRELLISMARRVYAQPLG